MRILYLTPRFPYPLLKGDQVVPYHRLRVLSQTHEITLLSLYEREEELDGLRHIQPFCRAVHTVRLTKAQSIWNLATRAAFSRLPLQALFYHSPEFRSRLLRLISEENFDLIHAYLMRLSPALVGVEVPTVIDLIDSMQLNIERRVAKEQGPKRWLFENERHRVQAYERCLGDKFQHLVVVSELDKQYIPGNVHVIPNGVDTDHFVPAETPVPEPVLIFSGNMGYAPNIHAVTWFVEQCFERIQAEVPDTRLVIAGATPSREVQALAQRPGISVTGYVDSMVRALHQARVAIAPMQSGSGVQNKILEAMACELPVVTTPLGLGSLKAQPGVEISVAENPASYAQNVISLLQDTQRAQALGKNARAFVKRLHSWEAAAEKVDVLYRLATGQREAVIS